MQTLAADDRVVLLSGAGLSAASGVPTFRGPGGLWEGHRALDLATPEAWAHDSELVRRFYDWRRALVEGVEPNPGHFAIARLQQALGPERLSCVTQNVDGLLSVAGCDPVVEMHGSLRRLRCERSADHPTVPIVGSQPRPGACDACGAPLRPDVVWFGEMPYAMPWIERRLRRCTWFVSVGTSGVVYPAAGFSSIARSCGATCIEINPDPAGGPFQHVIAEGAETALPRLVGQWLAEA